MKILSKRVVMKDVANKKRHCFDIIFEWEDILAKELNCEVIERSKFEFAFDEKCRKIYKKTGIPIFRLYNIFNRRHEKNMLMFDASTKKQDGIYNNKRYIPCIIDYFLSESEFPEFVNAYRNNRLVLISNKEVYEYLKDKELPFYIEHFPLSLSDEYRTDEVYEKKYDIVIAGRTNPLLMEYVEKYEKKYPNLKIVRRRYVNGHFEYYMSSTGELISVGDSREQYIELLRSSKAALYTTPGMDGTRPDANGWNQVTPRFLEEVASQCHIIARFPKNADTDWYEMDSICKCVQNYEDFENKMNEAISGDVDLHKYRAYLEKHYTSAIAHILKQITEKYQIN